MNEKGLLASYKVTYKVTKPHTIAEQLILPATEDIVETLFGESYAKQLDNIPFSNDTICERISDISADIQEQLESQQIGKLFAIQLDQPTDSNNEFNLLHQILYEYHNM